MPASTRGPSKTVSPMDHAAADDTPQSHPPVPSPIDPATLIGTDISSPADATTLLAVAGEIDHVTAPALQMACETAAGQYRQHLIIDLSEVTFMSSAGINLMVNLRREYPESQRLHLILNATVTRLWNLIGITGLFTIHPSRTAALAAITGA